MQCIVCCDFCDNELVLTDPLYVRHANLAAGAEGWQYSVDGWNKCPDCLGEAVQGRVS